MIRDETKRVRQPAAWLLLGGVAISVFIGLMAMFSDGVAAAANAGTLIALAGGNAAGPTFADRAVVASHTLTSLPVTAMAVAAVLLATHAGEKVRQARRITLFAVILQGIALLFGVLTWLIALGIPASGSAKLGFFLEGAVGVMVASAGLFFGVVTLRSAELQPNRRQAAPQTAAGSPAAYPGYGYGQPVRVHPPANQAAADQPAVGQGYPAAGYPSAAAHPPLGQQAPDQRAAAPTAQYRADSGQQYGAGVAPQYGQQGQTEGARSQAPESYGRQAYGSYGQQAPQQQTYQGGYSQQGYAHDYDGGYGQPSYGQGYGSYAQQGQQAYGQQVRQGTDAYHSPGSDAYASPGADAYRQYYQQQSHQAAEHGSADNAQPGYGPDEGEPRDST